MRSADDLIRLNRELLSIAERARSQRAKWEALGNLTTGQIGRDFTSLLTHASRPALDNGLVQKEPANREIWRNHRLLDLAQQVRTQSQHARTASSDARIQRCFSINRPGLWGDMIVAWVYARSRASVIPRGSGNANLDHERALRRWRGALDLSPAAQFRSEISGPH